MDIDNKSEAEQLYGRMMEDISIASAIEKGQFKDLNELKKAIESRAEIISKSLKVLGMFKGNRIISKEEFEQIVAIYESNLSTTKKH